jgi:hypothetical protein
MCVADLRQDVPSLRNHIEGDMLPESVSNECRESLKCGRVAIEGTPAVRPLGAVPRDELSTIDQLEPGGSVQRQRGQLEEGPNERRIVGTLWIDAGLVSVGTARDDPSTLIVPSGRLTPKRCARRSNSARRTIWP